MDGTGPWWMIAGVERAREYRRQADAGMSHISIVAVNDFRVAADAVANEKRRVYLLGIPRPEDTSAPGTPRLHSFSVQRRLHPLDRYAAIAVFDDVT